MRNTRRDAINRVSTNRQICGSNLPSFGGAGGGVFGGAGGGFLLILFLALTTLSFAQGNSGSGFNFQAVVRGADGFVLSKQNVELRFSLMKGQHSTDPCWVGTRNVITDDFGTVGIRIGVNDDGSVSQEFKNVNFAAYHYWLKVQVKEGGVYRELSYSALPSVPYAEATHNALTEDQIISIAETAVAASIAAASVPVGTIVAFAGPAENVPQGWLLCDGREIIQDEYPVLFTVIGTAWGTTPSDFRLPDLRGVFLRGVDNSPYTGISGRDPDVNTRTRFNSGGILSNQVGSYQGDAIMNITGTLYVDNNDAVSPEGVFYNTGQGLKSNSPTNGGTSYTRTGFDASRVVTTGGDVRPMNVYVNYIIKY